MNIDNLMSLVQQLPLDLVEEAFGSRDEIKEIIRQAASDDEEEAIYGVVQLYYGSCHQDILFNIAPFIPDILVCLLEKQNSSVQSQVLIGLAKHMQPYCRSLGYPGMEPEVLEFSPEPEPALAKQSADYDQLVLQTYKAVERHSLRFLPLLRSENLSVLANVIYVYSFLEEWSDEARQCITKLTHSSTSAEIQACAWIALGLNAWRTKKPLVKEANKIDFNHGSIPRIAHAIAITYSQKVSFPSPLYIDLANGARLTRLSFDLFPWCSGAIAGVAVEAMTKAPRKYCDQIIDQILRSFIHQIKFNSETCEDPDWEWSVPELVGEYLVRYAFSKFQRRSHEVTLEELNSVQKKILKVFLESNCHPSALSYCGFQRLSRRYLGIDPPGPMDHLLTWSFKGVKESWPIWKWWWISLRGEISENVLVERIVKIYTHQEVVDLAFDAVGSDYDINGLTPNNPVPFAQKLVISIVDHAKPLLIKRANKLLLKEDASISEVSLVVFPLLYLWQRNGQSIDWTYQPLISKLAHRSKTLHDQVAQYVPKENHNKLT
jgi:hypothetical protein